MAEKCRATSWRTAFCHPPEKRFLRGAAHSGVFAVRRLAFFAAFWSAVNRGLRPRKLMYFLTAKSTKNSPADAFAYFVPSNVRNGRLFAGLQANRPRFLPLLAGPSFDGSGIGPESFAASGNVQEAQPPHSRLWRNKDNRGLCPRKVMYFLAAKSTKSSPTDASAYAVPANAGSGRPPKRRVLGGCANIHKTGVLRRRSRF